MRTPGDQRELHTRPPTIEQFVNSLVDHTPPVSAPPVVSPSELARLDRTRGAQKHVDAYNEAVAEYENLRCVMNELLGRIWQSAQNYAGASGGTQIPGFMLNTFASVHLPSLSAPANIDAGWSTTRARMMAWQESLGRSW